MKQLTITALAGALLVLAGCMHTELDLLPGEEGIRITLDCGEIGTRTTYPEALEGEGNENLINSVDYFLFSSSSGYSSVIYSGHLEPKVSGDFTFYIKTTVAGVNTGIDYKVFTIVNLPESLRLGSVVDGKFQWRSPLSRSDLDRILLNETSAGTFASVTTADGKTTYTPAGKDLSLVMTGESGVFTVSDMDEATTVSVDLDRLPAKVTMEFFIKDKIVRNEKGVAETWTPMTDGANVRAYLCNGAKSIFVGESALSAQDDAAPIFNYQPSVNNVAIVSEKEGYSKAFRSEAFYSYPRKWNQGDKDEPFVKLIIPWKVRRVVNGVTTESQKEFYYKVMLPSALAGAEAGFVKNNWYRLFVDVDRLGSATDDAAVTVPCDYSVLDWSDVQDFNLNMVHALYLDVNEGKYEVVFYGDKLELPFFSSGNVSYVENDHYFLVFRTEGEYTYNRSSNSVSPATITTSTPISEWQEIETETVYVYTATTYANRLQPQRIETRADKNSWNLDKQVYRYTCSGQPDILTTTARNWSVRTVYTYTRSGYPDIVTTTPINNWSEVYEYTTDVQGATSPVVTITHIDNWQSRTGGSYRYRMYDASGTRVDIDLYTDKSNYDLNTSTYTLTDENGTSCTFVSDDYKSSYSLANTTYYYTLTDENGNTVIIDRPVDQSSYTLNSTMYYFDKEDVNGDPIIITYTYGTAASGSNIKSYYSGNSSTVTIYNANGEDIRITGGKKSDYSLGSSSISYNTGAKHEFSGYTVSVSNEEKYLTIDHELKVNYTNRSYDISPYIYEITLMLDGHEGEFDKKLKVTQYPSLYLDKVRSGSYAANASSSTLTGAATVFIRAYSFGQTGDGLTNVTYLNNNNQTTSRLLFANANPGTSLDASNMNYFMGTIIRSDQINNSGANTNQYIFEVNATILQNFALEINGASVDAVIGDPRVPEGTTSYELPDGSSFDFSINGLHTNGQYRPAANDTKNVISPKFRIASSFGRTLATTYEGAMRRCASYQENGYPAGRWRLPTMAEIQFVMRLYGDQKIDMLFDPDNTSAYWAGGGMARFGKGFILGDEVFVDMYSDSHISVDSPKLPSSIAVRYDFSKTESGNTTTSRVGVWTRCVYDTWYWGDEQYPGYNPASPSWLGFQTQAPTTN